MSRITLVVNPRAGDGSAAQALRDAAVAGGFRIVQTASLAQVRRAAQRAIDEGSPLLLVAGGDGTVSSAAAALAEADDPPVLVVVPIGTANDFARGCQLTDDAAEALALIEGGRERRIDVVRVTRRRRRPRYLINAATAGISGQLQELLDEQVKGWWGKFAYARVALELVPTAQVYALRLTIDDEALEVEASALLVCNGPRAGGVTMLPDADPGDGLLDVAILTANDGVARAALLARFALGTHVDSPDLLHRRCNRLEVRSEPLLHFVGDGEAIGSTPMTFELLPGKLRLRCADPADHTKRRE